jgi:AraC family transcriptional regulator
MLTRKLGKDPAASAALEKKPVNDALDRIQRGIAFIEAHLFERPPLAAIAAHGSTSPWHFHRVFVALTGETPANYVWKRQLSEICRRLVETRQPLVDLALDAGFESQASFTRAFTRYVGVSPARFRRAGIVSPTYRYGSLDVDDLIMRQKRRDSMEPRITRRPAFHVVGMAGHFTPATTSRIPELWERFARGPMLQVPNRRGDHTLGVCVDADPDTIEEAGFTYVAGVEVDRIDAVPDGMIAMTIPANAYAVFTHSGHISRLPDTVKQIWGHWLPSSSHVHMPAPDFELYDERWDPTTGEGDIDVYVPIAERAS